MGLISTGSEPAALGGGRWMQGAVKHPGALHRQLGVPVDKTIPARELAAAAHSDNPTLKRRAVLAETFRHAHHAGHDPVAHHNARAAAYHPTK